MPIPPFLAQLRQKIGTDLVLLPTIVVIARDEQDRILFVHDRDSDSWTLPGGIIEPGESPADAAVREVWEETHVLARLTRIVAVVGGPGCVTTYSNGDQIAWVATVFAARVENGTPVADGVETKAARFLDAQAMRLTPLRADTRRFLEAEQGSPTGSMSPASHLQLLARYNQWMNRKLLASAAELPVEAITLNRGAFFGSILGTLNHLAVGDTIWLNRFAQHAACSTTLRPVTERPQPKALDEAMFADLGSLRAYREWLDELIIQFTASLSDEVLASNLSYSNTKGVRSTRNLHALLVHFFNHQTHHRGQLTTLLFQAGIDPGTTDLLALIPPLMVESAQEPS